jgi:hypothetical protein
MLYLCNVLLYSETFIFRDTRYRLTTHAIKRSNQWLFVVTVGLHIQNGRQFQGTRQCAAGHSLEHVFLRRQRL